MTKKKAKPKQSPEDKPLNPRQRSFVNWYTAQDQQSFFNGTVSCRKSGYKGSDNVLAHQAGENLRKPHIAKAIRKAVKQQFDQSGLTVDDVLVNINIGLQGAIQDRNWPAVGRFTEQQGKFMKMFADRVEHVHAIEDVDTDVLVAKMRELTGKVDGLDSILAGGHASEASNDADSAGAREAN